MTLVKLPPSGDSDCARPSFPDNLHILGAASIAPALSPFHLNLPGRSNDEPLEQAREQFCPAILRFNLNVTILDIDMSLP